MLSIDRCVFHVAPWINLEDRRSGPSELLKALRRWRSDDGAWHPQGAGVVTS
jgi:hypothetical protein